MTRCLMCNAPATPETMKCACGSIAFYRGRRPDWPPVVEVPCDRLDGCHCGTPHLTSAAFLLGSIPRPPRLALMDRSQELAKPAHVGNGRHAE